MMSIQNKLGLAALTALAASPAAAQEAVGLEPPRLDSGPTSPEMVNFWVNKSTRG